MSFGAKTCMFGLSDASADLADKPADLPDDTADLADKPVDLQDCSADLAA